MKVLLAFLTAAFLSSCAHTALAPVANPDGVPVAIRVPGARLGQKPTAEQIWKINSAVEKGMFGKSSPMPTAGAAPAKRRTGGGFVGMYGDVKTKRGERFVAYAPMVIIRGVAPAEQVERAALLGAVAYYRSAKKSGIELTPYTDLVSYPKTPYKVSAQ